VKNPFDVQVGFWSKKKADGLHTQSVGPVALPCAV